MSMDLGLDGRVALVMGASRGIGPRDRRGAGARRSAGRDRQPLAGADRGGRGGDRRRRRRLRRRRHRPRAARRAAGRGRGGARPGRDPRRQHRRAAARRRPRPRASRSGSRPTARWSSPRVTLAGAVVPGMRERGWGRIVNVGSTSTREPIPGLNLSNAHRMAAVGFLKTLAREVAGDGITVNTVATGRFATERLAGEDGSLEARRSGRPQRGPGGAARHGPRSTATSSPSSAPSAPPTSPAPRSRSTAVVLRSAVSTEAAMSPLPPRPHPRRLAPTPTAASSGSRWR